MIHLAAAFLLAAAGPQAAPPGRQFDLPATPATVAWGHYDAAATPVLTVRSGDTVVVHTLLTNSPKGLEAAGLAADQVEPALRAVFDGVPAAARGPGGHILTGPIAVEGARPGDTLEVRILKIDLAIPYAYNAFGPTTGFLPDDFPYRRIRIVPLDRARMVGALAPGVEVPLHPFFGSMGVAPPPAFGRYDSTAPAIHGGNMDNRLLVAGTALFLPVHVVGALLEVGDGHAAQGNGEVDVTALETSLTGTLQLILHRKGEGAAVEAPYPRAETPASYVAMGYDEDLSNAARKAVRGMIDFLVAARGMTRDDAYMLVSAAGDVEVTELVDRGKGVHVALPRRVFTAK